MSNWFFVVFFCRFSKIVDEVFKKAEQFSMLNGFICLFGIFPMILAA